MNITEKEAKDFLNLLYSYVKKRYEKDQSFNKTVLVTGATIVATSKTSNEENYKYQVKINPYDSDDSAFWCYPIVPAETFYVGDLVFLIYWGDLTNAKILCKNR